MNTSRLLLLVLVCACARAPIAQQSAPPMKPTAAPEQARLGTLAPGTGLTVGSQVPSTLMGTSLSGERVKLSALHTSGPILLVFYRGGWCPFCNFQIRALSEAAPRFAERGITPVVVSVDRASEATRTSRRYEIPFPVLSDETLELVQAFHVVKQVDETELTRLRGFGMDLEASAGKNHHVIAVPSMFLIDSQGVVRWAHSDLDYKVRPSIDQLLKALDGAK